MSTGKGEMKKYPVFLLYCLVCAAAFGGANGDGTVRFTGESFKRHMQGLAAAADRIYWSHTDRLAVTDTAGSYIKLVEADYHHGDICINGGKLYAAVNKGKFNRESGAENFVYVYDLDLNLLEVVPIDFMPQGLGAIEFSDGSFYLGGGALKDAKTFKIYKCSKDFKLEKVFEIPAYDSELGVQTICSCGGFFWFGCYMRSGKEFLWKLDKNLRVLGRFNNFAALGISRMPAESDRLIIGRTKKGESGLFDTAEISRLEPK